MGSHRPAGAGIRRRGTSWLAAASVALPVLITIAWVPLRARLPNVDVALLLVLAVTASGAAGRRVPVVLAALGAAMGFAYFDTTPYEHFVVNRQPDVETLIVLLAVSLATGELAVRVVQQRHAQQRSAQRSRAQPSASRPGQTDMARVRDLAAMVASGAELVEVIGAVAGELTRLFGAASAGYEAGESAAGALVVTRDGVTARVDAAGRHRAVAAASDDAIEVPVTGLGRVLGRFCVAGVAPSAIGTDRLLVALTLADQVGAALIAQAPESASVPGPESDLRPTLRVVD